MEESKEAILKSYLSINPIKNPIKTKNTERI